MGRGLRPAERTSWPDRLTHRQGGVAEWFRQRPAKPFTRVRFPAPPLWDVRRTPTAMVSERSDSTDLGKHALPTRACGDCPRKPVETLGDGRCGTAPGVLRAPLARRSPMS